MKRFLSCLFVLTMFVLRADAQELSKLLDNYNAKVPLEKVYVQFDNSSYTPGQTVWYKAYLQSGNKPSFYSTSLYLDWYDAEGNLTAHLVAPVMEATAWGSYTLPASFRGKTVRVSAYTKWMLNFDSSFFFQKTLTVLQKPSAGNQNTTALVPEVTLGFYPEGGDLVENIRSTLAFKAINTAGEPVNVSGIIAGKDKKQVAAFSTLHNGMGRISFTPLPGETYTAEWKDPRGVVHTTPLPLALASGIVLTINNTSVSRSFTIERSANADDKLKKVSVVATMNQQVLFSAGANLVSQEKITANIPTERFPSGVLRVSLLDANRQPVAERVLFVNNDEYRTDVSLKTDTLSLEKKGRNVYQLVIPDSMVASMSVSVTDSRERFDASSDIFSGLLLSPEIKGRIHDPAYYFSSSEEEVSGNLDLVMLTNGWRRFAWPDVIAGKLPALRFSPDTSYINITASVSNLKGSKISKAGMMNLLVISKDSTKRFLFAPLDKDGSFRQENLILYDTATVYFRLNNGVSIPWKSKVNMLTPFLKADSAKLSPLNDWLADTTGSARIFAIESEKRRVDSLRQLVTLEEVTVFAKQRTRMEQLDERHTSGAFKNSGRGFQYNILDDKVAQTFPDIFTWLQGKLPGASVKLPMRPTDAPSIVLNARRSLTGGQITVPIYVNEMLVDGNAARAIPVSSISYVKLIPPPFVEDINGGQGGALAIYTLSGDDISESISNTPTSSLDKMKIVGYSPVKEFYSPNYAEEQPNMDEKDLRRTLLWQPNIQPDEKRKYHISFFNNDMSTSFRVVIEGMTADGKLVHVVQKVGQ